MRKNHIIFCILIFLSSICSAQIAKISIEKVNHFSIEEGITDSLSKLNTMYQLVLDSNIITYYPATDTTAFIECSFVNKSANPIIIDTTVFKNFTLFTCNHRWPLHLHRFEIQASKDSSFILMPNEKIVVFRATLMNLCFSDEYMWDWAGHPAPPKSPIHVSYSEQEEYLNETYLYFAYNIDGIVVLSNILKLKINE